jgi:predicted MFS family arabinose efflux permease
VLLLLFTWLLFRKLPADPPRRGEGSPGSGMAAIPRVLRDLPTSAALGSNYLSTSYWFVFATYMGAYFYDVFGLAAWALGGLTMTMGLGVLLGSNAGGRLSDRVGKRPVILWSSLACAIFIALTTTAAAVMAVGLAFLFLFAVSGGARFASAQAIMTEMSPGDRGTVMALNASGQQFGIVTGSVVGGLALEVGGYTALGPTAAVLALVSMAMYGLFVQERGGAGGSRELATG